MPEKSRGEETKRGTRKKTKKLTKEEELARKEAALEELRTIPRVGPLIAEDLWFLGIESINDLKRENPSVPRPP